MRIKNFKIFGFKSESRIANLDLTSGPISVIYGPNGVGKTTILQIMSAFFSKNESVLLANKVKKVECTIIGNNGVSEHKVFVEANNESSYHWYTDQYDEFDQLRSLSIGVERGIAPQNLSINPANIFDFLYRYSKQSHRLFKGPSHYGPHSITSDSNFRDDMRELSNELAFFLRRNNRPLGRKREIDFEISHLNLNSIKMENIEEILVDQYREARYKTTKNIQSALFETIADLVRDPNFKHHTDQNTPEFIQSLIKYRARIEAALLGSDDNAFMHVVLNTLKSYCESKTLSEISDKPILTNLFINMIKELEAEDASLNGINVIVAAFNEQLEFGKKLIVGSSRSAYITIDGEDHRLNELSSGERHILTFLTLISTAGRGRDFIFIDEPEISLNLRWQRKLLSILQGILPDCQIIAASHSPAISQNPNVLCQLQVKKNANAL